MDKTNLDIMWILFCTFLVFLMQPGFMCLESGLTRSKNSINVAVKNVTDLSISIALFGLFGFAIMFGVSHSGWFGTTDFLAFHKNDTIWSLDFFLFQAMFCGTAATIVSGAVAERLRFSGYILITVLLSSFIYPFIGHWCWNSVHTGATSGWLEQLGFHDFAGATVVHGVGAWVALAVLLVVGPREGRFSKDGAPVIIQGHNYPMAILGVLLLWVGWFGFNGGSVLAMNAHVPLVIANTMMAAVAGLLTALAAGWIIRGYPDVLLIMNGALAGLVAVTAGADVIDGLDAVLIGGVGALVMIGVDSVLVRLEVDDAVGAVSVHGGAGVWGTLAVALFGNMEQVGTNLSRASQLGVQFLGCAVAALWAFGIIYVLLKAINAFSPIRVTKAEERKGLNVAEHRASTEGFDLLLTMEEQAKTGDLGLRAPVQSYTEVGQIASHYNQVVTSLQNTENKTAAIFRVINEGILSFSPAGVITSCNPKAADLFGRGAEEMVGTAIDSLFSFPHKTRSPALFDLLAMQSLSSNQHPVYTEMEGRRHDGDIFPLELSILEVALNDDTFYTAVVHDITERKKARDSLTGALRVAEAANAKANAALKESEEHRHIAEAATRAKSDFLANMSHELRTPMNGIIGFTEILLSDDLTSEQRESLDIIKTSSDTLLSLINDILDLAKIEADRVEIEETPFDLENIIYDCADLIRSKVTTQRLEILVDADVVSVHIISDPVRLQQIIMNLLGNAIKFTTEGEIIVSARFTETDSGQASVKFSVHDTGIGMSEDQLEHIFDSFTQADTSTTRKYGGTGLGLTISRRLTALLGGELTAKSEPGVGSSFYFTLNLRTEPIESESENAATTTSNWAGKHCLVVDDNAAAMRITCDLLTRLGIKTISASSAKEGLRVFKEREEIEFILTDIIMPDIDGFAFERSIKEKFPTRLPTVVALTSTSDPATLKGIKEGNFEGCLSKPLRKSTMINLLKTVFANDGKRAKNTPIQTLLNETHRCRASILLAEDNAINRKLALKLLRSMGHRIEVAENGQEAVDMCAEKSFELIFMDVQMPVLDGLHATRKLRAMKVETPIIAMTANAMAGDREICLDAGMTDYITKPIKRDLVERTIEKYCGGERFIDSEAIKRILIIDDDMAMQEALSMVVQHKFPFASLKRSNDGIEACTLLGSFHPHLVITDICLPGMDGTELVKFLRTDDRYQNTGIVVITGLSANDQRLEIIRGFGVENILHKPFDNEELSELIDAAVAGV